jgi:hypothetical protein
MEDIFMVSQIGNLNQVIKANGKLGTSFLTKPKDIKTIDFSSLRYAPEAAAEIKTPNSGKSIFSGLAAKVKGFGIAVKSKLSGLGSKIKNAKVGTGTSKSASKVGSFFKGKGGKIGLIAAGLAALAAGGAWLYNKFSGKTENDEALAAKPTADAETDTTPVPDEKETETPDGKTTPASDGKETETPDGKTTPAPDGKETENPDGKTTPAPDGKETENPDGKTTPTDGKEEPAPTAQPTEYTVVRGDNVWNIAKQHLKDLSNDSNYKPSNAEILKHTKELMEINGLKFEADGYRVMIRPGDKLKLAA